MPSPLLEAILKSFVLIFGGYVLLKFSFFFVLSYEKRRKMLDATYVGTAFTRFCSEFTRRFASTLP